MEVNWIMVGFGSRCEASYFQKFFLVPVRGEIESFPDDLAQAMALESCPLALHHLPQAACIPA